MIALDAVVTFEKIDGFRVVKSFGYAYGQASRPRNVIRSTFRHIGAFIGLMSSVEYGCQRRGRPAIPGLGTARRFDARARVRRSGAARTDGARVSLAERAARERTLQRASSVVEACRKCSIGSTRRNSVYGEGDPCARVMVVGEGPGENEDKQGRPFIGRAGELLEKMLGAIGLAREDVFICNTVKCRPTLVDGVRVKNRAPDASEMKNCRPYLDEQIEIVRPEIILALGAPAAKTFMGEKFSISKQRGQWYDGPGGIPTIATFHPAYILRQTGGEITATKRLVYEDLKQVRARLDAGPPKRIDVPGQSTLFD